MASSASALAGKVILISGAASGIGAATAAELLRRGALPALFDRDAAALQATRAALGGAPLAVVGDVLDAAACEAAVAQCVARHGGIDIVWANAGVASLGPLALTDPQQWVRTVETNVVGTFHFVRAALRHVMARRGLVAVTASAASIAHLPAMSAYAASKAALEAMCDAWRIELAAHGVQVTAIHPSWIKTPMVTEAEASPAFVRLRRASPPPLRAETEVDDLARAIADALAERARRVFVPRWVRWAYALRSLLHLRPFERDFLAAASEIERLFAADAAARGTAAASAGTRLLQAVGAPLASAGGFSGPAPSSPRERDPDSR